VKWDETQPRTKKKQRRENIWSVWDKVAKLCTAIIDNCWFRGGGEPVHISTCVVADRGHFVPSYFSQIEMAAATISWRLGDSIFPEINIDFNGAGSTSGTSSSQR
jgi:hypothetical protein